MATTATSALSQSTLWLSADATSMSRRYPRDLVEEPPSSPVWPGVPAFARPRVQPPSGVPELCYVDSLPIKSGVALMLRDPPETAWHWPTSKGGHSAARSSASDVMFGSCQDAQVAANGTPLGGAVDPDVLELTFKNDLYHTYRPLDHGGGSIATTSEPDTRRVPDIGAAVAGLASSSTPDLHRAMRGMPAEELPTASFSARHESPSIPEDMQAGTSGFDANVPQYVPLTKGHGAGGGRIWDSALGSARAAMATGSPSRGKRGGGSGGSRAAVPASQQHGLERQASGKAQRTAADSVDPPPALTRSGSGLSRWASSLTLGATSKRDSKKGAQPQHQTQHQQQHQQQQQGAGLPQDLASPPQGLAAQERQRSGSMLTSFFGRFGKSAAASPASYIVSALSSSTSKSRSPVTASPAASSAEPYSPPGSPMASASSVTEHDGSLRPLRRSASEPMRNRRDAVEADAARVMALEEDHPINMDTAGPSCSRQSRETVRRSDVRIRSDIQSEPPPDRDHRRRRAFALEDVDDEFVTADLAQRSTIFNEGLRQVPSNSRPRQSTAQRGSEWA